MRFGVAIAILFAGYLSAVSQTNQPSTAMNAEVMQQLRTKMLTNSPAELGQKSSSDFPRVCGVVMDWPIESGPVVSVVSLSTGDASIYTTGTFGVFGGIGHGSVRNAAKSFVKAAEKHYDEATPTKEYPYPKASRVRFYLICYDGVRTFETDLEATRNGKTKSSDLYKEGQQVLTELRLITQKQKGETSAGSPK
jgi:hypothetical protein